MKANIRKLVYINIGIFLLIIIYLSYLQIYKGEDLAAHPKNRRVQQLEARIIRGSIYDRRGEIIVQSSKTNNIIKRSYTEGDLFGTIIGYNSIKYGKTGIEESYNKYLLGLTADQYWSNFITRLKGKPQYGDDLYLSLDFKLQSLSRQLLGNRKGAVVALNPKTGEVLALYSNPGFDPNKIDEIWPEVSIQGEQSPLLNRATQGLYPPGSTMKIITGSLALQNDSQLLNKKIDSPGSLTVDGFTLKDHSAYGQIDFYKAMQVSSNVVFARLGLELGKQKFYQGAQEFGFNRQISFDIPVAASSLAKPDRMSNPELASSAIGQGEVLATPLQMALVASTIANNGQLMRPWLVSEIKGHDGKVLKKVEPTVLYTPTTADIAAIMKDAMVGVVENGTGTAARIHGIKVAGKTGTAENPHGASHAWFIGFAPADKPQIAVAVIVENVGYGATEAAPIAREIMARALN